MTEAQIQLQNALTTTFLANLAFLSEYDNDLYHRVDELSRMIENGSYKEKYALEFIIEEGDFDIYDILNDKYLYKKNPKKINNEFLRNTEFNLKNAIFNLSEYFSFRNKININKEHRFNFHSELEAMTLTQNDIYEYSNSLKDFLDNNKKKLKKINKFIFLGTLLGRHIPKIAEKVDADLYLVVEKNLEIFRLSLFTVDYTILAKKGVVFSIMDREEKEEEKIKIFTNINYLDNYIIKFVSTSINIDGYVDKILANLVSQKPTVYDYNRILYINLNRKTKVLNSQYRTILCNHIVKNSKALSTVPVLYLSAGPSLDENLSWIKENENKFFIVTIGAAYKKLLKNKIRIDMITTLDEDEILNELQFDEESISQLSNDTVILANSSTNDKILEKLKKYKLFLYETLITIHNDNVALSGYSIGELTLDILLKLNVKKIYLMGLDLALNQQTGLSHSKNSDSEIRTYDLNEKNNREYFSLNQGVIKVKGNLCNEVSTTSLFYMSIKYLEEILVNKSLDVNIYNLSSHGAYLEGTEPTNLKDLKVNEFINIDFKSIDFNDFLEKNSLKALSSESKKDLEGHIKFVENLQRNQFLDFKRKVFENYKEFSSEFLNILSAMHSDKFNYLFLIIDNYSKNIIPYLSYHFNDIKVKKEKNKVNNIKEVCVKQIEDILEDYILFLKRVIK